MLRAYTLPADQAARAIAAGGPLQDLRVDPEKLAQMTVAVVEVDGQVVAYWVAWYALHLEPLWIHPDHQKSPGVARALLGEMQSVVQATGEPAGFAVIEDENLAQIAPYAERLGFQPAPGRLYYLVVQPPATQGEE